MAQWLSNRLGTRRTQVQSLASLPHVCVYMYTCVYAHAYMCRYVSIGDYMVFSG